MRGNCFCETVQFELDGNAFGLYQCHCSQCRRQSGSLSSAATIAPDTQFRWLSGTASISSWSHSSGFRSDFCAVCGSPVPNTLGNLPYVWVPAGLLEDGGHLEIVAHVCVDSKASWDRAPLAGMCYPHLPERIDEFVSLLRRCGV